LSITRKPESPNDSSAALNGATRPSFDEVNIHGSGRSPHWGRESGLYGITFHLADAMRNPESAGLRGWKWLQGGSVKRPHDSQPRGQRYMRADFMRRISIIFAVLLITTPAPAQNNLQNPETERRVDELLQRMTLEEKVGQLVQCSAGTATGPGTTCGDYQERIAKGQIGSLLNVTGAVDTNALQRVAVEQSRLKIPLLFGLDVIHGYRTIFPVPLGMASTWDPDLIEQAARVAAIEAAQEGVRWTFSPMVDIARDARWGRIVESAGEDPHLGSILAAAYVRGYQGTKLDNQDSLAACAKHYVGYGAAQAGRDYSAVDLSERSLRQVYLPPFQAAVSAGVATVMSAFNPLNAVPASANATTLTNILRQEWDFPGFVVSDWNAVGELIPMGVANDGGTAARKAINAGVDMDMQSGLYGSSLGELVRSGAVPQPVLDGAVRRVLRVKFALGLFDHPYTPAPQLAVSQKLESTHLQLARILAERSLVLLKNEPLHGAPLLPISPDTRSIALVGPLTDSAIDMLGSWPGKGDRATVVTLKSALAERTNKDGRRLAYAKGTDIDSTSEAGFQEAVSAARQSELVIAALGERAETMTGEAASRTRLDLPGNQEKLLEQLVATGKPVVLVVFSGRPLALAWAAAHVPAMVEAWYPGVQAGPALVRALFGDDNFSGKLTVSIPRAVGQEPLYYSELKTGRPAEKIDLTHAPRTAEEKYVSRYIDEQSAPLFPFGYGLSYTHFSYSKIQLSSATTSARALNGGTEGIRVSSTVTNSGMRPGREIVQLYLAQRGTSVVLPIRELKGFRLITLGAGESQRVEFTVGREQLAFWNIDMHHVVEPAEVTVWIGPNSVDGQTVRFTITE
jgi:beta-glucosidase